MSQFPSEQQVAGFFKTAGKRRSTGGSGAARRRTCKHCTGSGHDIRTCRFKSLDIVAAQVAAQRCADAAASSDSPPAAAHPAATLTTTTVSRKRKAVECQHCHGVGHNQAGCKWRKQGLTSQDAEVAQRRPQAVGSQV